MTTLTLLIAEQREQLRRAAQATQRICEMKHTSGPWVYDQFNFIKAGEIVIALVEGTDDYEFDSDEEFIQADAEIEANGHLMAAAPEMYQALKRLLEIENQHAMGLGEREVALEFARAAIVKAEATND